MPIAGSSSSRGSTGSADYTDDLRLAHVLADDADSLTQARFKALDLHVMSKPDLTPVTDADRPSRRASAARSRGSAPATPSSARSRAPPGTASAGGSSTRSTAPRTSCAGVPVWATLIALAVDDEVVLGVVSAPQLQRRWWASAGNGAWTGRSLLKATKCEVSDVRRLEDASLSLLLALRLGRARPARRLPRAVAALLAHPRLRRLLVLHARSPRAPSTSPPSRSSSVYDMAALDVIVREAGGRFTSLDGTTVRGAATRWPPTATSTTRRCPSSAPMADDEDDPTSRAAAPGSVQRPPRRARDPRID